MRLLVLVIVILPLVKVPPLLTLRKRTGLNEIITLRVFGIALIVTLEAFGLAEAACTVQPGLRISPHHGSMLSLGREDDAIIMLCVLKIIFSRN